MTLMVLTLNQIRVTVNSAKVRRAIYNGRDYLVAPLTLIVPGVLPGSKGPLYYPLEEIKANYSEWDWVPIVVNHPYEMGQHVWATLPKLNLKVLEKSGIGFLLKTNTKGGKLRSEGWFDIEHTQRIEPRIYEALITNTPIELSTGLGTTDETAPAGSKCPTTGRPYLSIARNYRPDHLAVLPDQVGACSLDDGCGVLVNQDSTRNNETNLLNLVTNQFQSSSLDDGFVLNMWSEEAREAAAIARKAGAHAHKLSARSLIVKSRGYTGAKADSNAAKAHDEAVKAYMKAEDHHVLSARAAGKTDSPEEQKGWSKLYSARKTHEDLSKYHSGVTGNTLPVITRAEAFIASHTGTTNSMKSSIWMKLGDLLGVTNSQSLSVTSNASKKDEKGRFTGESEEDRYEDDGSLSEGEDENEPPEGSLAATLQKGKSGKMAMNRSSKLKQLELVLNAKEEAGESNKTQGGTDTSKLDKEPPIEDAVEHEDDHQKKSQERFAKLVENAMPFGSPPGGMQPAPAIPPAAVHEASKQASMASVGTAHEPVAGHAITAIQSSQAGNSPDAAAAHKKAASMHDTAATQSMKSGDMEGSDNHANAAMLHRKAASLHTACPMAAPTGNKGGSQVAFNRKAAVAKLTANCKCSDDRAAFNKMSDATLQMLTNVGQGQAVGGGDGGSIQAGGEEDAESEIDPSVDPEKPKKAVKSKMGPEGGESTMNELLKKASPRDRQTWDVAQRIATNHRVSLVQKLVGHIKDDEKRKKMAGTYNSMDIGQLEAFVENMPPTQNQQQQQGRNHPTEPSFNYLGAGGFAEGGTVTDNADGFDKSDILPLPTINDLFDSNEEVEAETA